MSESMDYLRGASSFWSGSEGRESQGSPSAWPSELIGAPILRAGGVARRHELSHQGAMNALRRLAALGVVEERTRNGRIRFTAPQVIALLR